MKQYLMLFSHSEFGAHAFHFKADDDSDAKKKALNRLEASPMGRLPYEIFEVRPVGTYDMWTRQN